MTLTLEEAELFVSNNANAEWDGWNIVLYRKDPNAFMRKNAAFRGGDWCLKTTVAPNSEGRYVIGKKQAPNTGSARN